MSVYMETYIMACWEYTSLISDTHDHTSFYKQGIKICMIESRLIIAEDITYVSHWKVRSRVGA